MALIVFGNLLQNCGTAYNADKYVAVIHHGNKVLVNGGVQQSVHVSGNGNCLVIRRRGKEAMGISSLASISSP